MILIDANLLIDAVDSDAPRHRMARRWLDIAALAPERGAHVNSSDHDFARFPAVWHINPLAG